MSNVKEAKKEKQLEITWSSPSVPVWAQLPSETRREATRLLAEMLIEEGRETLDDIEGEDITDE